jgi:hypothetical protein
VQVNKIDGQPLVAVAGRVETAGERVMQAGVQARELRALLSDKQALRLLRRCCSPRNLPPYRPPTSIQFTLSIMRPATRLSTALLRRAIRTPVRAAAPANCIIPRAPRISNAAPGRAYHPSMGLRSILPDAENPKPKESEAQDKPTIPTDISTSEFHERADSFLNELVERLEEAQEKDPNIDVEFSVRYRDVILSLP